VTPPPEPSRRRPGPWAALAALLCLSLLPGAAAAGGQTWTVHANRIGPPDLRQEDLADARRRLAPRLLKDRQRDPALWLTAARLARQAGDYDAARKYLAECLRLGGDAGAVRLEQDLIRAQRGELGEVERGLRARAARNAAEAPLILEALGRAYLDDGQFTKAFPCFTAWLERQPDNPRALLWRGWLFESLGRARDAADDYRRAAKAAPTWVEPRRRLAALLVEDQQPQEAAPLYEGLLKERPKDADFRLGLARCRHLESRDDEARKLLDDLLKEQPHNAGALAERARLALNDGRPAEAERLLRQAVKRRPSDHRMNYYLYLCLQRQGKTQDARAQLTRLKRVREDVHRLDEILKRELPQAPRDPALRCEAGQIFLRHGRDERGLHWLYSALRIDAAHRPSHQALADYYQRTGDRDLAERHRRKARPE
jgi:Tfp pilus assembly protein PilF